MRRRRKRKERYRIQELEELGPSSPIKKEKHPVGKSDSYTKKYII